MHCGSRGPVSNDARTVEKWHENISRYMRQQKAPCFITVYYIDSKMWKVIFHISSGWFDSTKLSLTTLLQG